MPQPNNSVREQLLTLEKLVKKIIRKSLKNNTLDYQIQFSLGNLNEPGKVKYDVMISSPAKGVQPITFSYTSYEDLKTALEAGIIGINKKEVELTFHQSRINAYESRIEQHKARMEKLNDPDYDESEEEIEMEEVGANGDTEEQVIEREKNEKQTD